MAKTRKKKDVLTRAIEGKRRSISASLKLIASIRAECEERVTKIRKNIAKQQVLLDALEKGTLQP